MVILLCIFFIVSVFEVLYLIRTKEKKEAAIYIVISVMTVVLALYLILVPEFKSFARIMLDLFKVEGS